MSESAPAKVRPPVARAVAAVRVDVLVERRGRVELQLVLDGHDAVAALDRRDDAADADGEVDVRRVGEVVLGVGGLRARDVRRTGVERKRVELEVALVRRDVHELGALGELRPILLRVVDAVEAVEVPRVVDRALRLAAPVAARREPRRLDGQRVADLRHLVGAADDEDRRDRLRRELHFHGLCFRAAQEVLEREGQDERVEAAVGERLQLGRLCGELGRGIIRCSMLHALEGLGRVFPRAVYLRRGSRLRRTRRVHGPHELLPLAAARADRLRRFDCEAAFLADGDRVGHLEDRFDVGQRVRGVRGHARRVVAHATFAAVVVAREHRSVG